MRYRFNAKVLFTLSFQRRRESSGEERSDMAISKINTDCSRLPKNLFGEQVGEGRPNYHYRLFLAMMIAT